MSPILFAAGPGDADIQWGTVGIVAGAIAAVVILLIFLFVFFSFVQLWIQCMLTGAGDRHVRHDPHEAAASSTTP